MAAMLKPSAVYNRRAAIIEGLRAKRSATEIIRFFKLTVYDIVAKYTALEQSNDDSSMPARKSHSKKRIMRIPVERVQALISDDPRHASIVGVSEPTMRRIVEKDLRYKSYTLNIRQMFSEAARTSRVAHLGSHTGLPTAQI